MCPSSAGSLSRSDRVKPPAANSQTESERRSSRSIGRDVSSLSDTESLDLIEYMLFSNMVPWGGKALPIT